MSLSLILGRCDSLRAEIFLRAPMPDGADPGDAVITGTLRGPECRGAITLPVTAKFVKVPGGAGQAAAGTIVVRAILTEPSYWTPDLPSLYQFDATLAVNGREIAVSKRRIGLRRFGARGRSLWLDGRRYVPRGLVMPEASIEIDQFRDAASAAVVADPSDTFLDACDTEGVAVIGVLADGAGTPLAIDAAADRVARWSWHPSVLIALAPAGMSAQAIAGLATSGTRSKGTMLLAQEVDGSLPPSVGNTEALLVSLREDSLPHPAWHANVPSVPLLARRPDTRSSMISRRSCDALQAALASCRGQGPAWDWAGYCVDVGSQSD